jgi:hypothetical protein
MPHTIIDCPLSQLDAFTVWVRAQGSQNSDERTRLFALLDVSRIGTPTQDHPAPPVPRPLKDGINLYGDLEGVALADVGPRLFCIDDGGIDGWVKLAAMSGAVSFLAAAVDGPTLAEHLQSLREVELPDGSRALFRFQDTKVTSNLWPLLTPGQINCILGPAQWWLTPDACGTGHRLTPSKGHVRDRQLRFERKQYDELNDCLLVYTVAEQVRETDSDLLHGLTACQVEMLLRERLQTAGELGLKLQSDKALYTVLSLQLPVGFENEAPFAQALERNRQGLQRFGDALDQTSAEQWRRWNDWLDSN